MIIISKQLESSCNLITLSGSIWEYHLPKLFSLLSQNLAPWKWPNWQNTRFFVISFLNWSRKGMGLKFLGLIHFINTNWCYKLGKKIRAPSKLTLGKLGWNGPRAKNKFQTGSLKWTPRSSTTKALESYFQIFHQECWFVWAVKGWWMFY